MTTKIDFTAMTGPQLVSQYNEMVLTAVDLGLEGYKPVTRFATPDAGRRRCEKLHEEITKVNAAKVVAPVLVDIYKDDGTLLQAGATAADAAEKLIQVTGPELLARIAAEGFCLVDFPAVLWAVAAGQPFPAQAVPGKATENTPIPPAPAGETAAPAAQPGGEAPQDESEDEMAKKRKAAAAKKNGTGKRAKSTSGETIRELTEQYNGIVAKMNKAQKEAAPFAKHHTSMFESKDKAKAQLAKLNKAIAKA